jgi:hypothetical protein
MALIPAAITGGARLMGGGIQLAGSLLSPAASDAAAPSQPRENPAILQLQSLVARMLSDENLEGALPLELVDEGNGVLRVESDHPRRQEIERLLRSDPQIASRFRELSANHANFGEGRFRLPVAPPTRFDASA